MEERIGERNSMLATGAEAKRIALLSLCAFIGAELVERSPNHRGSKNTHLRRYRALEHGAFLPYVACQTRTHFVH